MYYIKEHDSAMGKIWIACDEENIKGVWLEGQKYFMRSIKEKEYTEISNESAQQIPQQAQTILNLAVSWLDTYFSGKNPSMDHLPLAPDGTPFQQTVWKLLRKIPYGELTTYGALAKEVALQMGKKSMSAQAIGGAVGHNPISILIPCHRVVGTNGSLTGYAGGIDKKIHLLALEGVDMTCFSMPQQEKEL